MLRPAGAGARKDTTVSKFRADPEVAKQNLAEALETLRRGVAALDSVEGFTRHLSRSSRGNLLRYSVNNQILILSQRPGATEVGGFRHWIGKGRKPLAGRGIRILAPATYHKTVTVEHEDGTAEDVDQLRLRFRTVTVWDIRDTDGPVVPVPAPQVAGEELPFSDGDEATTRALALDAALCTGLAETYGCRVEEGREGKAYGVFYPVDNRILVNREHDAVTNAATVAHEAAHAVVHHTQTNSGNYAVEEQVAEGVSFAYLCRHGLRTDRFSFSYIKDYHGNAKSIAALLGRIGTVVAALVAITEGTSEETGEEAA